MRERLACSKSSSRPSRITPAYAGKTQLLFTMIYGTEDHPRVCGKDGSVNREENVPVGSPPRMRERQIKLLLPERHIGITPAYAGKTNYRRNVEAGSRDHPRVCGKDVVVNLYENNAPGSPPRMRERH